MTNVNGEIKIPYVGSTSTTSTPSTRNTQSNYATTPVFNNSSSNTEVDPDAIENELGELEDALGINQTQGADATQAADTTQGTSNLTAEEVEDLKDEYDANQQRMEAIKEEVEKLSEDAAEIIADALAMQEAAVAEAKEESQKAIDEQLQAYIKANQEGGEGMTREQLQANIAGALPDSPSLTKTLGMILDANEMLSDIDGLLSELKCLITTSADLKDKIDGAGAAAENASSGCKDPIGFVSNNVEYNFFVDKDGDGSLSQTNEFLGAENNWNEMSALDTENNDGIVGISELVNAGVQLAGTDGSVLSTVEDYTKAFGENFSINVGSYTEGGTHSAIDTVSDTNGNGIVDQTLLGTFNLNVNGSTVQGYNTLDDEEWLSSTYGVAISEDASNVTEDVTSGLLDTSNLGDLQAMGEFYNTAYQQNQMMRQQLEGLEEAIGFDTEAVDSYKDLLKSQAEVKAKDFVDNVQITPRERETSSGAGSGNTAISQGSYNAELGQKLSDYARNNIPGGDGQSCLWGVSTMLYDEYGFSIDEMEAADADDYIRANLGDKLVEVTDQYAGQSLSSLPPGIIIVWERGSGSDPGDLYGHIAVLLGDGTEVSDIKRDYIAYEGTDREYSLFAIQV